jgi:Asp-tRNA(Asn)/Glu-tRNA(Gln) amidotransferase A subunit family amidase
VQKAAIPFNIVDATIEECHRALQSEAITSVQLVVSHLLRIASYDLRDGLNAFTVFNPDVFQEAEDSDQRIKNGLPLRPLEGIPYTLKDSFKYKGLTVSNGSPAFQNLVANEDSVIAKKLRKAGAILVGKTNMPPMACGGMQRGLYGRAESPYNRKYLVAAFSSGSSNGAAVATTSSMAVFGMGSETVSSGRSPASNNALVAYTPSRGVLSCRGLWPLYVTCDVPVPYSRTVGDMLKVLSVIAEPDVEDGVEGDFWRQQTHVQLPAPPSIDYVAIAKNSKGALQGKRIGIPRLYIGEQDSDPHAKPTKVCQPSIRLWQRASEDLQALGAEIVHTDFPLVTNYENDSVSGEVNNVLGAPAGWSQYERGVMCAKAWDDFLKQNADVAAHKNISNLAEVEDPQMIFPKPNNYLPDEFFEIKNGIDYATIPLLAQQYKDIAITDIPGVEEAVIGLENQRKRDLEDWMDCHHIDCFAFPANGDVGLADLEFNIDSARHSLQNGVKYSHGNRAIRHMGVPTVSVPMGIMDEQNMPLNLTFVGKAYEDALLLSYAHAYEQSTHRRVSPPLTPELSTDTILGGSGNSASSSIILTASAEVAGEAQYSSSMTRVSGTIAAGEDVGVKIEVFLNGRQAWETRIQCSGDVLPWETILDRENDMSARCLSWDLNPLPHKPTMILVVAKSHAGLTVAKVLSI